MTQGLVAIVEDWKCVDEPRQLEYMTSEVPDLFNVDRLAEYGISHLSDNVILLQYVRADSRLHRAVTVVKSRASAHDPEIREFEITSGGIVLGDPIGDEPALG